MRILASERLLRRASRTRTCQRRPKIAAFNLWPQVAFNRSCVFCSASQGRLRGCISILLPTSPMPPQHLLQHRFHLIGRCRRQGPSRPEQPTPTPPATTCLRARIGLSGNETNSGTSSATSLFHLPLQLYSRVGYHPNHPVQFFNF